MNDAEDPVAFVANLEPGRRLFGLDLGTKTIGIALSDERFLIATPLVTLSRVKFGKDAAALMDGMKAQGFFNAWPQIVRTSREIAAMEPEPMRVWPSAAAITRLEQTSDWVLWIDEAERKLVWSRAARVPWKQISGELGCDRTTAWRRWQLALTKIAARLNA